MEFTKNLNDLLDRQPVSSKILLNNFRLIDENSRLSASYADPRYLPFYYYLGKFIHPISMIEVGFGLGLASGCFFKSCKSVNNFFSFQEKTEEFYSPKFGIKNIKNNYKNKFSLHIGKMYDDEFIENTKNYDFVIINERMGYDHSMSCLEICWKNLEFDGYLVMDSVSAYQPSKESFDNFCKSVSREPVVFKTRYGTGIVRK